MHFRALWSFALLMFVYTACRTPTYIPNTVNVPMFREPHEMQTTGYVGLDHAELQCAYSPDSVHGLMLNAYWISPRNDSSAYRIRNARGVFLEAGCGYTKRFGMYNRMEMYAGYGYGYKNYFDHVAQKRIIFFPFEGDIFEKVYDFSVRYHRLFGQVSFGRSLNRGKNHGFCALTLRAAWMLYPDYDYKFLKYDVDESYFIPVRRDTLYGDWISLLSIDPVFTLRFRTGPVYIIYQTGYSVSAGSSYVMRNMGEKTSFYFSFGVSYIFPAKKE